MSGLFKYWEIILFFFDILIYTIYRKNRGGRMILRKPFAILIKYFKAIHILLTAFSFYLVYRTNMILSFLSEYMGTHNSVIGKDLTSELYSWLMYLSLFIIIVGSCIILALMLFKQKKVKLYIYNIFTYVTLGIIFAFSYSVVSSLEIELVDVRTLKIVQDLITTSFILQIISLVMVAMRATGFNVQKFNFTKDLQDLEIEDLDNEEFEINIDLDYDDKKRKLNRMIRHTKYVYRENKFVLLSLIVIVIGVTCLSIYLNVGVYNKVYSKNEAFTTNFFVMQMGDSYSSSKDYRGNEILKNESLIMINMNLKRLATKDTTFDSARLILKIDEHHFYHDSAYKNLMFDMGEIYLNQNISTEFDNYVFIYKIPTDFLDKDIRLIYTDYNGKQIQMDVNPISLIKEEEPINVFVPQVMTLGDSILSKREIKFDSVEIADSFRVDYKFCVDSKCYQSYEYLKTTLNGKNNKVLLKIKGSIKEIATEKKVDLYTFINQFGYVEYQINNETKTIGLNAKEVKPTKTTLQDECYVEVTEEVKYADSIKIVFKIRNKTYKYIVK